MVHSKINCNVKTSFWDCYQVDLKTIQNKLSFDIKYVWSVFRKLKLKIQLPVRWTIKSPVFSDVFIWFSKQFNVDSLR